MVVAYNSQASYPASPFNQAGVTSFTLPWSSVAPAWGDALVLCCINSGPQTFSTPSGFVLKQSGTINSNLAAYVFTKQATGTETGNLTITPAASAVCAAGMLRYTGAHLNSANQIRSTISTNSSTTNATTSTAAGTLSPAPLSSTLVVRCYCWSQSTASTSMALSNPGGTWATRLNLVTNSSTFNCGMVLADKLAGTDNQTVTASGSNATGSWLVADIAIDMSPAAQFLPMFSGLGHHPDELEQRPSGLYVQRRRSFGYRAPARVVALTG